MQSIVLWLQSPHVLNNHTNVYCVRPLKHKWNICLYWSFWGNEKWASRTRQLYAVQSCRELFVVFSQKNNLKFFLWRVLLCYIYHKHVQHIHNLWENTKSYVKSYIDLSIWLQTWLYHLFLFFNLSFFSRPNGLPW